MFVELIATFVAGIAAAGAVMLVNRILKGRLPRWFTPVAAGFAMIVATISNEYGWFSRTKEALPDGVVVAQIVENTAFYRPWTFVWPFVERFVAVDTATAQTHSNQPGMRLADVYFFGRWAPVNKLPVLADCPGSRRAALSDAITFQDDGVVSGAKWVTVAKDDPIVTTICGES